MKNTLYANLMLAPLVLLLALSDNIICAVLLVAYLLAVVGAFKHSRKIRKMFIYYLQTVEDWERAISNNK